MTDPLQLTPAAERQLEQLERALIGIAEEEVLTRYAKEGKLGPEEIEELRNN